MANVKAALTDLSAYGDVFSKYKDQTMDDRRFSYTLHAIRVDSQTI